MADEPLHRQSGKTRMGGLVGEDGSNASLYRGAAPVLRESQGIDACDDGLARQQVSPDRALTPSSVIFVPAVEASAALTSLSALRGFESSCTSRGNLRYRYWRDAAAEQQPTQCSRVSWPQE